MGKLHTLRRAIEREPERWSNGNYIYGAVRKGNTWLPYPYWGVKPYQAFVAHVLRLQPTPGTLGNADTGSGGDGK